MLAAALAAAVALFFALDLGGLLSLDALKARQAAIEAYRAENPWRASAIYFALYVAVAALSLPGATLMTLAGGAVFGLGWGALIVSFASSVGATLAFLASRFLLRDWVAARFGSRLEAIDAGVRREGAFYLFALRLVPLFPFFLINLLFGLTAMRARSFYWVSQLGMLPATVLYVNAGTQMARIDGFSDVLSPGLLLSFSLLGLFPLAARRIVDAARARRVYAPWTRPRRFSRNLVVVGAGAAGLVAAYVAAAVKARVTLVEKDRMGGDCLNTGCVPSKALIRSARLLSQIASAEALGLRGARADCSFAEVMGRVRRVVQAVEPHDSAERYAGLGVEVIEGEARLVSPWEVEVVRKNGATERLTTRSIVIAAGARPAVPPIPGIEAVGPLTSDTVWDLRELPPRLLVLGGGPIGCELAQAFARLGSRVTQVEMAPRLLAREDPEVSELVERRFREEGIDILVHHRAARFLVEGGEKILIAERVEGGEVRVPFDAVLVAVGRAARLTGYGLEALGVAVSRTVETNGFLQTNYPNIYAAGDVAGPFQFTHVAAHQAGHAAVNALFDPFWKFRVDYSAVPWATFTDPEVARVGLNEQEAKEKGIAFEVSRYRFDELDRAIADGETRGFVKLLTVPGRDRILGVTIVGEHAGDLIAEYVLAMRQGIGLGKILGTIHIYPTLAEANQYAAGAWKKAHAPERLLRWAERFHGWRRG